MKVGFPTYAQRYFEIADFYKPGGPILILVGGETNRFSDEGFELYIFLIVDIARSLNGYAFVLEHRYYGESIPFK